MLCATVMIGCMSWPKSWAQDAGVMNLTSVGVGDKVTLTWDAASTAATTYNIYSLDAEKRHKDRLNDVPVTECSFCFDYPVDRGGVQHKDYFAVTCVKDGTESADVVTGVLVGDPYKLPMDYDFSDHGHWVKGPWSDHSYWEEELDQTFWEGEHAVVEHSYTDQSDWKRSLRLDDRHAYYTIGKIEMQPNAYLKLDYQDHDSAWGYVDEYQPTMTLDVYAIDPYGRATLLTDDGSGRGYPLTAVYDYPWVRIKIEMTCDYDQSLWNEYYDWPPRPELYVHYFWVKRYAELDRIVDVAIDGVCYHLNLDMKSACVINPSLVEGEPAYSGEIRVPAEVLYDGVTCQVTEVADDALKGAEAVTLLELPATIPSLKDSMLEDLSSLTSLYLHYDAPDGQWDRALSQKLMAYLGQRCTLYVPVGALDSYLQAQPWRSFARICEYDYATGEVVRTVEHDVILEKVNVYDNVVYDLNLTQRTAELRAALGQNVDMGAYRGTMVVPASIEYEGVTYAVTSINDDALCNCISLRDLTLPSGILIKQPTPFVDCFGLKRIRLGEVPPSFITDSEVFSITAENAQLFVPLGYRSTYKQHKVWSQFERPIVEVDEEGNECLGYDPEVRNLTSIYQDGKVVFNWEADMESATFNVYRLDNSTYRPVAKLNSEPVTDCTFTIDWQEDELQYDEFFAVMRVTDDIESIGAVTRVIVGEIYRLPYVNDFNYKQTVREDGRWISVPYIELYNAHHLWLSDEYYNSRYLHLYGQYASYNSGKIEVKPNMYMQLEYIPYEEKPGINEDYAPKQTLEVYAVDPYDRATLLTDDGSGRGYPLTAVEDYPWMRIRIVKTCDYKEALWSAYYPSMEWGPTIALLCLSVDTVEEQDEAIEAVSADAASEPMHYTLDGKPVLHPYRGVFVVKKR